MIDLSPDDRENLTNALRFAGWALDHVADVDRDWKRFYASRLHRHAIVYCILCVGELTGKAECELKTIIPHIPWQLIKDMRNILAHNPANVNLNIVWRVATYHLPLLISALEPVVGEAS